MKRRTDIRLLEARPGVKEVDVLFSSQKFPERTGLRDLKYNPNNQRKETKFSEIPS